MNGWRRKLARRGGPVVAVAIAVATAVASPAHAGDLSQMLGKVWTAQVPAFEGWEDVPVTVGPTGPVVGMLAHGEDCGPVFTEAGVRTGVRCERWAKIAISRLPRPAMYEVLLHEYAHARDWLVLTDSHRDAFRTIMGYEVAWHQSLDELCGTPGRCAPPAELYADAFAWCGLNGSQRHKLGYFWYRGRLGVTRYGWAPTKAQARAVCDLVRGPN